MNNFLKRLCGITLALLMIFSTFTVNGQEAYAIEQDGIINVDMNTEIILENGNSVTPEEFLQILDNYEGEIYRVDDEQLENIAENVKNEQTTMLRSAAVPIDDVMKIMAGTWYIPGIGKIVVAGGAILIGGVAIYKVSGWVANKVKSWLTNRAIKKQTNKAISDLGGVNSNKASHILQTKHKWSSLVPGDPKDPNRWNKIKKIIKKVMKEGTESRYGSAYKRTLRYKGKVVEVTFQKLKDGVIKISNAWVK